MITIMLVKCDSPAGLAAAMVTCLVCNACLKLTLEIGHN